MSGIFTYGYWLVPAILLIMAGIMVYSGKHSNNKLWYVAAAIWVLCAIASCFIIVKEAAAP